MVKLSISLSLILGGLLHTVSAGSYDEGTFHGPDGIQRLFLSGSKSPEPSIDIGVPVKGTWEKLDQYLIDLLDHSGRTDKVDTCSKVECRFELCALPVEDPQLITDYADRYQSTSDLDADEAAQMFVATRFVRGGFPAQAFKAWSNAIDIVGSSSSGVNQTQINHYPWAAGYEGDPKPFGCTQAHKAYSGRVYLDRYRRPAEDVDKISFVIDRHYPWGSKLRAQCVYGEHVDCDPQ